MSHVSVTEVMTAPVLTVERDERPADVSRAMVDQKIKSVVVIDDDCQPVGILTSTDFVRMTATGVDPHETTVGEFMTTDVVTVTTDQRVPGVADLLVEHGISHLPVVDDDGQAIGIVSATDLTEHLAERV